MRQSVLQRTKLGEDENYVWIKYQSVCAPRWLMSDQTVSSGPQEFCASEPFLYQGQRCGRPVRCVSHTGILFWSIVIAFICFLTELYPC